LYRLSKNPPPGIWLKETPFAKSKVIKNKGRGSFPRNGQETERRQLRESVKEKRRDKKTRGWTNRR